MKVNQTTFREVTGSWDELVRFAVEFQLGLWPGCGESVRGRKYLKEAIDKIASGVLKVHVTDATSEAYWRAVERTNVVTVSDDLLEAVS
jgi:hypothetical protein